MRIYETPEITVEEISTQDIVLVSGSTTPPTNPTPTPGGTGTPIIPFSTRGAEEVSTFGIDGGADVGDAFGNF